MPTTSTARKPKGGSAKVFGITTAGQVKSAHVLKSIGGRGADARPAWPAIFSLFTAYGEKRFTELGPGWPPLAEATKETKARKNQDPRLMRVTGALQKSLVADRARGGIRKKSRYQLTYGSKVFYARFHQAGKGVPKRVLVEVTPPLASDLTRALERYVVKGDLPDRLKPKGIF